MSIPVTGPAGPAQDAMTAIRRAGADADTGFAAMLRIASLESGLDPTAQASTSSARGLFQFTEGTWLDTVRKHGDKHGLGWAAEQIERGVEGPGRSRILALRDDPELSARMAYELAEDNRAVLEARVGGPLGETETYLAHFLGAGAAARFIAAERAGGGSQAAAELFPRAAAANQPVFYDNGRVRSLSEVRAFFERKLAAVDVPAGWPVREPGQRPDTPSPGLIASPARGPAGGMPAGAGWVRPVPSGLVSYHTALALAELGLPGDAGRGGSGGVFG